MKKTINIVLFCIIIYAFFVAYLFQADSLLRDIFGEGQTLQTRIARVDEYYAKEDVLQSEWIELYGASQRIMGKEQIENFTIFKNRYGGLVSPKEAVAEEELEKDIENIMSIMGYCKETEVPTYYITGLLPVVDEADLPVGVKDFSHQNAERLLQELTKSDFSIINLREAETIKGIEPGSLFYKTDHHWSIETCFAAFQHIIWSVEEELSWNIDQDRYYTAIDSYEEYTVEDAFLGSYGIKVGQYYAGKDDFCFFIPRFDTQLKFESYRGDELQLEKQGTFVEALMDAEILTDEEYNNKYNSFANGQSVENRITNYEAPNDKKVLLISHSYGRPLAQYISLCFGEVRHLDPQEGRYTDSYVEYIENYKPDLVLILAEFEGEWIVDLRTD